MIDYFDSRIYQIKRIEHEIEQLLYQILLKDGEINSLKGDLLNARYKDSDIDKGLMDAENDKKYTISLYIKTALDNPNNNP